MILPVKKVFVGALALGLLSCTWFEVGKWNSASAASPVYYVSPNGNDVNLGTSENVAFRTIQKAADAAKAGSTILVRSGIYNESVTVKSSGSSTDGFISFQNYPGESPVIDGTNLSVTDTGLFNIADKSYIRLKGFEIRNLHAVEVNDTPIGVQIQGTGHHIEVRDNYIHHIESGRKGGNAHGIAVFGTSSDPINNLNHIVIDHNEVANLKLGLSEAVAVNGNVDTFEVTDNKVHDNNNIGIVIIGHEGKSPVAGLDQARNGIIRGNAAYNNSSNGNSSYNEYSAGGIYVDGGKDLIIEQNVTHDNDIGIEVASEHAGKSASNVKVRNNLIYLNIMSGITLGGYDRNRGYTENCFFMNNKIYKNDTLDMGYGQITFNNATRNNVIENNVIYSSDTNVLISNPFTENTGNVLDSNLYFTESGDQTGLWQWKNVTYTGFVNYKRVTGNDSQSIFADPKFTNLTMPDLHLLPDSPARVAKVVKIVLKLDSTTVLVNGKKNILEVAPTLIGSTTMVPLRFITETLGAQLAWNGEEKRITLTLNHDKVVIWINKTEAKVNLNTVMMAAPAKIVNGKTLVPVRFISENLKEEVNFNSNTSEITITGKQALD